MLEMPKRPTEKDERDRPALVRLGRDPYRRIKAFAVLADRSVSEVLTEAVEEYLKKRGA
jgi:hypothetical protein